MTSMAAMSRPAVASSPCPSGRCRYSSCAHFQCHEAMYCTEASAHGITETMEIQFDQAPIKPTSEPWRIVAVANHSARLGKHRPKFRVGERNGHDDRRASTQAQIDPGPARPAARQAPNSHPDPMIEPSPVSHQCKGADSRRIGLGELMRTPWLESRVPDHGRRNAAG